MDVKYGLLDLDNIFIVSKVFVKEKLDDGYVVVFPRKNIKNITKINYISEKVNDVYDTYDEARNARNIKNKQIIYIINQKPYGLDLTEKLTHEREKLKYKYLECLLFESKILNIEENKMVDDNRNAKKKVK